MVNVSRGRFTAEFERKAAGLLAVGISPDLLEISAAYLANQALANHPSSDITAASAAKGGAFASKAVRRCPAASENFPDKWILRPELRQHAPADWCSGSC